MILNRTTHNPDPGVQVWLILLTAALLKLKVFLAIPLACLARELLSMQGKPVNNKQTFVSWTIVEKRSFFEES